MTRRLIAWTFGVTALLGLSTALPVGPAGGTAWASPASGTADQATGATERTGVQLPRGCSLMVPTSAGYTGMFAGSRPVRVAYAFPQGAYRHGAYVSAARDGASHEIAFYRDGRVYDSSVTLVSGTFGHGASFRRTYGRIGAGIPDVADVEALPAAGGVDTPTATRTLLLVDFGGRLYGQRISTDARGRVTLSPAHRLEARGLPPLRSLTPVGRAWDRRSPRYATGHTVLAATKDGRVVGIRVDHRPTTHITAVTPFLGTSARASAVLAGSCHQGGRDERWIAVVARDGRVTAFRGTPGDLRSRGRAQRLSGRLPGYATAY